MTPLSQERKPRGQRVMFYPPILASKQLLQLQDTVLTGGTTSPSVLSLLGKDWTDDPHADGKSETRADGSMTSELQGHRATLELLLPIPAAEPDRAAGRWLQERTERTRWFTTRFCSNCMAASFCGYTHTHTHSFKLFLSVLTELCVFYSKTELFLLLRRCCSCVGSRNTSSSP